MAQDNWSIHQHRDVLTALSRWPRIEPIWLPTYAPWLNPTHKLWRLKRQDVLKLHRLAGDWPALRQQVRRCAVSWIRLRAVRTPSSAMSGYWERANSPRLSTGHDYRL